MTPIWSTSMQKDLVYSRGPTAQCVKDILPIKSASSDLVHFYPPKRMGARKLLLMRSINREWEVHCMPFGRTQISKVPPMVLYGMDQEPNSTSKNNPKIVEFYSESTDPSLDSRAGQMKALDSYFTKLCGDTGKPSVSLWNESDHKSIVISDDDQEKEQEVNIAKIKSELGSLDNYFDKLKTYSGTYKSKIDQGFPETSYIRRKPADEENNGEIQTLLRNLNGFVPIKNAKDGMRSVPLDDVAYDEFQCDDLEFSLINFFVAIDIAVFLFETASPIRDSHFELLSLPLLYGAKVNKLIIDGEWWRIVTPMFLNSGFPHVALNCWVLLSFGPQVCHAFGPFTFLLTYLLGGICANMTSFLLTPELTVSGTGPIFAIIGAWLVYQFQNKEAIPKEVSDSMYQKAVIATALSFFLADYAQTDEWTHLAAALSGVLYGFFTCPTTQLNNPPSENNQKGAAITHRQADPFKSAVTFIIFITVFCPLVYMLVPELDVSELSTSFIE